jgi:hypothetical protein
VTLPQQIRSHRRLLLVTVSALVVGWLVTAAPIPIYDGIGAPDEPYRFVSPPPGDKLRTAPPTQAVASVLITSGTAGVVELFTDEQGPQAQILIVGQTLKVSAGPGSIRVPAAVTVTVKPLAPEAGPSGLLIDGNIYELSWDADGAITEYTNDGGDRILLRAVRGPPPKATFLYRRRPGDAWRPLETNLAGADVYQALIQGEGDYALTVRGLPASASAGSIAGSHRSGRIDIRLLAGAALVVVLVAAVVAVRVSRRRGER